MENEVLEDDEEADARSDVDDSEQGIRLEDNRYADNGPFKDVFPGASARYGRGPTFMENFDSDRFSEERAVNPYYPFASRSDWEMGAWLLRSGLSMAAINEFLSLEIVSLISYFRQRGEIRVWLCPLLQART